MERDSREIKQMAREYVKSLGYRHGDVITEGALYHAFKDGFHEAMEFFNTENTVDVSDSPGGESDVLHADGGSNGCTVENSGQESVADQMEVITDSENFFCSFIGKKVNVCAGAHGQCTGCRNIEKGMKES